MKPLRDFLHLTQKDLAELLGVSQSAIALYEKDLRQLPPAAGNRLDTIKNAWLKQKKELLPPTPDVERILARNEEALAQQLEKQLKAAERQVERMQGKLQQMKLLYQQALEKNSFVQHLEAEALDEGPGKYKEVIKSGLWKIVGHNNPAKQVLQSTKLAVAEAVVIQTKKALKQFAPKLKTLPKVAARKKAGRRAG